MLRLSKLTDYATVLLGALATSPEGVHTAGALAGHTHIAAPTVSKVLKALHRAGLVTSTRGLHGGYRLARPPAQISAAAILDAIEGPLVLTDCVAGEGHCGIERHCHVGRAWQRVNLILRRALDEVSLAQLAGLEGMSLRLPGIDAAARSAFGARR